MALRLRRGTDAERLLITPLQGELIYTNDTKQLYAGDGTTAGGILVSADAATTLDALNDTDLTGKINGDVLQWNSTSSRWEAASNDGVVEGSNYRINIVGNDSSILLDTSNKTFIGKLKGSVAADDGTILVDATQKVFDGRLVGNTTGVHTGDVNGSVFGDDSTLLVDGVAGKITGPIDSASNSFFEANLQLFKNVASDATRQQVSVYSNQHGAFSQTAMNITNTGDTAVANELGFFKVRGTAQEFTATQASDSLGGVSWAAYDGSAVQIGNSVKSEVVSISANNLAAKMCFYVRNGLIATYVKKAELSETGVFKVNAIESFTADTDLTIIANGTGAVKITDVQVFLPNLPTSDPSVAGQLWSNSGVVTISAG